MKSLKQIIRMCGTGVQAGCQLNPEPILVAAPILLIDCQIPAANPTLRNLEVPLFERIRAKKSMTALAGWFNEHARSVDNFIFQDALPAPMLVVGRSDPNVVFITVKNGSYMLYMDEDHTTGAVATWQILGSMSAPPNLIVDRAVDTLRWVVEDARKREDVPKAKNFAWNLEVIADALNLADVSEEAFRVRFMCAVLQVLRNPTSLNWCVIGAERRGLHTLVARAQLEQGYATERAIEDGDARFDTRGAVYYYEKAMESSPSSASETFFAAQGRIAALS